MDAPSPAEDIYFELYEYVSDKAEYLQPGGGTNLLLPEAMAAALVATILTPFLKGFFETIGKETASAIVKKIRGEKNAAPDTESLLRSFGENLSTIQRATDKFPEVQQVIYHEFIETGISDANSQILARQSIEIIRRHLDTHASRFRETT